MKKSSLIITVALLAVLGISSCYKTCEDPFAPNYTLKGACTDLTSSITGVYYGQLTDSVVGLHSSTITDTVQITKLDASHIQVSSSSAQFVSFSTSVSSPGSGYSLTVPAQTSSNGLNVTGAGVYFGSAADGIYTTAARQLNVSILAGTQYQIFSGTQQ